MIAPSVQNLRTEPADTVSSCRARRRPVEALTRPSLAPPVR